MVTVSVKYTVKKVTYFPVPSRDVTNQTLPGRELFNISRPGRACLVTSRLGTGKLKSFFTVYGKTNSLTLYEMVNRKTVVKNNDYKPHICEFKEYKKN
jgi:hypothetical protein